VNVLRIICIILTVLSLASCIPTVFAFESTSPEPQTSENVLEEAFMTADDAVAVFALLFCFDAGFIFSFYIIYKMKTRR